MTTFDVFLFSDELDMLECRLLEAQDHDVRHVLIEAPYDHHGNAKPLWYAGHKERFRPWCDRIEHVIAEVPGPECPDPWVRERAQREHIWAGLTEAAPDDIVLVCDVDEIPGPYAYDLQGMREVHAMSMSLCMFAVDWVCTEPQRAAVAAPRAKLCPPMWVPRENGLRALMPELRDFGWHLSWLGGPEAIERKARLSCHGELRDLILAANKAGLLYEHGHTWHGVEPYPPVYPGRLKLMVPATVDATWPRYVRERRCPAAWFRPAASGPLS